MRHQFGEDGVVLNDFPDEGSMSLPALEEVARTVREWLRRSAAMDEPVVSVKGPRELLETTSGAFELPEEGSQSKEETRRLLEGCLQGSVRTSHPLFLNQLYAAPDPVGLVGDWLSAAVNSNAHTYEAAPLFTAAERHILEHVANLFGFGRRREGVFLPGSSMGNAYAFHLARHERFPEAATHGMAAATCGGNPCAFVSENSHYSYRKAATLCGIGTANVVAVRERDDGSMDPQELRKAIKERVNDGRSIPFFVGATAGTTVRGAFDDLQELRRVCDECGDLWLHVDAAWGAAALLSPNEGTRALLSGLGGVDSACWSLHKLLGAPIQCSALLVQRDGLLRRANSLGASYLFQPDKLHADQDLGDLTLGCGRRGDGFKMWLMWRVLGSSRLTWRVGRSEELAACMQRMVRSRSSSFSEAFPRSFATYCFWFLPPSMRPVHHHPSEWQEEEYLRRLGRATSLLKQRLQTRGEALIAFQPMERLPNFFRVAFAGSCPVSENHLSHLLDLMEIRGADL